MPLPLPRPRVLSISPAMATTGWEEPASGPLRGRFPADAPTDARSASMRGATPPDKSRHPTRWVQRIAAGLLLLTFVAAVAISLTLAIAHARDRAGIGVAAGSWIALAWCANHGELYPPLRDSLGNFAGTRYMPLHILAHARLARITGEYLFSGRIIGYGSAVLWIAGIIALARRRGCHWLFACGLAASVMLSPAGVLALCTIRSDSLALSLQLWALWIMTDRAQTPRDQVLLPGLTWIMLAAVLCALAFLTKLTAVWGAVAIGLWLMRNDRRGLLAFMVTGAIIAGGLLLGFNVMTEGRLVDNILHTSAAGWRGWASVATWAPGRLLQFVSEWSPTTWALVPAAALALLLAAARRDVNVLHLAWPSCGAVLLVMLADAGVGENHVLELAALIAVLAGDLWGRATGVDDSLVPIDDAPTDRRGVKRPLAPSVKDASLIPSARWSVTQLLLAIVVCWCTLAGLKQQVWGEVRSAVMELRQREPAPIDNPHALDALIAGKKVLSDDPTLAVLRNDRPVVIDAFVFRHFEKTHSDWTAELAQRIARHEFGVIALTHRADANSWWYRELFFGPRVTHAISDHYRLMVETAGYAIYVPKDE